MARHKVYAVMTPHTAHGAGNTQAVSSRSKIDRIVINLNADCFNRQDVPGKVEVNYDPYHDSVTVYVDCPNYNVRVWNRRNDTEDNI